MKAITQERAEELDAAWKAASEMERLTMNRMSWFSGGGSTEYYEEEPSRLERAAAARIATLEAALRDCIEIAVSDCEHDACKLVIERASKLVQLEDL